MHLGFRDEARGQLERDRQDTHARIQSVRQTDRQKAAAVKEAPHVAFISLSLALSRLGSCGEADTPCPANTVNKTTPPDIPARKMPFPSLEASLAHAS